MEYINRRFPLVEDVLAIIVDFFAQDCSSRELAALTLVSSAWLNPVRRALYASPRMVTYHSCYLLSQTLAENPRFADRIHSLHLHPVSRICPSGSRCSCRDVNIFAFSLSPLFRLQRLFEISLGGDCAMHAEQYLKSLVFPQTIRKLRVEGIEWHWSFKVNGPVNASLRWTEGLASRFTNLRILELANLDLRISEPQAFKSLPVRLESVCMDRVQIRSGRLSYLALNSWKNLEELTIIVSEYGRGYDVRDILGQASESLRTFRYLTKEMEERDVLDILVGLDVLASCTCLRHLELSIPFGHSTLKTLGTRLNRLESLKVHSNYEISIAEWVVEISKGIFPALRELHLPIRHDPRRLADDQWPALHVETIHKACADRGISLTYAYLNDYSLSD